MDKREKRDGCELHRALSPRPLSGVYPDWRGRSGFSGRTGRKSSRVGSSEILARKRKAACMRTMINRSLISPRRCSQTRYSLYREVWTRYVRPNSPGAVDRAPRRPPPFSLADRPLFPPLGPPVVAYCSTEGDPVIFPILSMVVQIGINIELLLRYRYLARYRRRAVTWRAVRDFVERS